MKKFKVWKLIAIVLAAAFVTAIILWINWVWYKPFDHLQFFKENEQAFTEYAERFLNQSTIENVSRNKRFYGVDYGIRAKNNGGDKRDTYFTGILPYREEAFWVKTDAASRVKDEGAQDRTLQQYLAQYQIPEEEYFQWRTFLAKYGFLRVGIPSIYDPDIVEFSITPEQGFWYSRQVNADFPYSPEYRTWLNDHWVYFDERGINYDKKH